MSNLPTISTPAADELPSFLARRFQRGSSQSSKQTNQSRQDDHHSRNRVDSPIQSVKASAAAAAAASAQYSQLPPSNILNNDSSNSSLSAAAPTRPRKVKSSKDLSKQEQLSTPPYDNRSPSPKTGSQNNNNNRKNTPQTNSTSQQSQQYPHHNHNNNNNNSNQNHAGTRQSHSREGNGNSYFSNPDLQDFSVLKKLGEGSFSTVYCVRRGRDNKEYAMKRIKIMQLNEKERQNAINEVRFLASIQNKNIISYKQAIFDDAVNQLCVIMEYAEGGDLSQVIRRAVKAQKLVDERTIWSFAIQITHGLKALHDLQVLHRDLKSANVFLDKHSKRVMLGDLNVSKQLKSDGLLYTQTGTPYYASPEVWKDKPYGTKSDIWSLGCVVYEMAALQPPFKGRDMQDLFKKVQRGIYDPIPYVYSEDLRAFISHLLRVNPDLRPSCDEILKSPVVTKQIRHVLHSNDIAAQSTISSSSSHQTSSTLSSERNHLLSTIRIGKGLHGLKDRLPISRYDNETHEDIRNTSSASSHAVNHSRSNGGESESSNNNNNKNQQRRYQLQQLQQSQPLQQNAMSQKNNQSQLDSKGILVGEIAANLAVERSLNRIPLDESTSNNQSSINNNNNQRKQQHISKQQSMLTMLQPVQLRGSPEKGNSNKSAHQYPTIVPSSKGLPLHQQSQQQQQQQYPQNLIAKSRCNSVDSIQPISAREENYKAELKIQQRARMAQGSSLHQATPAASSLIDGDLIAQVDKNSVRQQQIRILKEILDSKRTRNDSSMNHQNSSTSDVNQLNSYQNNQQHLPSTNDRSPHNLRKSTSQNQGMHNLNSKSSQYLDNHHHTLNQNTSNNSGNAAQKHKSNNVNSYSSSAQLENLLSSDKLKSYISKQQQQIIHQQMTNPQQYQQKLVSQQSQPLSSSSQQQQQQQHSSQQHTGLPQISRNTRQIAPNSFDAIIAQQSEKQQQMRRGESGGKLRQNHANSLSVSDASLLHESYSYDQQSSPVVRSSSSNSQLQQQQQFQSNHSATQLIRYKLGKVSNFNQPNNNKK